MLSHEIVYECVVNLILILQHHMMMEELEQEKANRNEEQDERQERQSLKNGVPGTNARMQKLVCPLLAAKRDECRHDYDFSLVDGALLFAAGCFTTGCRLDVRLL